MNTPVHKLSRILKTMGLVLAMTREHRWFTVGLGLLRVSVSLWDAVLYSLVIVAVGSIIKGAGLPEGEGFLQKMAVGLGLSPQEAPVLGILGALAAVIVRDLLDMLTLIVETRYIVAATTTLRRDLLASFYRANQSFLDDHKSSDRDQIHIGESRKVVMAMVSFLQVLGLGANLAVLLLLLLFLSPLLTGVLVVLLLPLAVVKYHYTRYLKGLASQALAYRTDFWRKMKDYASGIKQIKLAGMLPKVEKSFRDASYKAEHMMQKEKLMRRWENPMIEVMGLAMVGVIVLVGRSGALTGAPLALSVVIAFLVLLNRMVPILSRLGVAVSGLTQNFPASEYVHRFYDMPARYLERTGGRDKEPFLERAIEIKGLTLDYRDRPGVLRDINMTVAKGERVGLVGPSGAGKSSLAHLLLGLYEPSQGRVTIDGVPLTEIAKPCLWANLGLVSQDLHLFDLPVREVIAFARQKCSEEEVRAAAQKANAHAFIEQLPQGYDTVVGEMGARLSGGEKQRLLISQVFLKDPEVIIFDEATSALDSSSEKEIMKTIDDLTRDKTLIMIAHRLATLRDVDRIYVLEKGRIVESGVWDDLVERGGLFWQMVQNQLLREERQAEPKREPPA
jgi:ABC-type multidrug transport system fused ATPase/permease subunit